MSDQSTHGVASNSLGGAARAIHFGLMLLGAATYFAGDWAGDYKKADHSGFTLHMWLGLTTSVFIFSRVLYGFVGPLQMRFTYWVPYTRERFEQVIEDVQGLLKKQVPDRPLHGGLAGLVQAGGIAVFALMAISGTTMAIFLETGQRATGWIRLVKEVHELSGNLVAMYLIAHVGAVVLHSLMGKPVWQRAFGRK